MNKTLALALALLAALGCRATTNPTSPGVENEVFNDLPAAPGMTYDKGYGYKSPPGQLRSYEQQYSGSRRIEDVKAFYEQALPHHGWTLKNSSGGDPATLTFENKMEKVDVKLQTVGGLLKVTVTVGAK
jgi:hypothetical protein